jgi:hypothetical protein
MADALHAARTQPIRSRCGPERVGPIAGRRTCVLGEAPDGGGPAGAPAPLGPVLDHAQAQWRQVKHLSGLAPDHHRIGQIRAAPAAPVGGVLDDLIGTSHLGQMSARRAGLLTRPSLLGPLPAAPRRPRGLAKSIRGRWLDELEESSPSRRSSSATRVCWTAIRRACSALAARNSVMTASWTRSGQARLPMGHNGTATPTAISPSTWSQHHDPALNSYEKG